MTMVLSAYDYCAYHKLGDVRIVAEMVTDNDIRGIGENIVNHGYEKTVSVALAHKHFDLTPNEVMLETSDGNVRIAKPVDLDNLSSTNAQPSLIVFGNDNLWRPVQFGVEKMPSAFNDVKFLKDVAEYLVKNNLQDKLMLAARDANFGSVDGSFYVERNYAETRTSETTLASKADIIDAVKTTYGFTHGINGHVDMVCISHCKSTSC